jgi:hypothetical protein
MQGVCQRESLISIDTDRSHGKRHLPLRVIGMNNLQEVNLEEFKITVLIIARRKSFNCYVDY